ncbi:hypothetical protein Tco_1148825, partial [Tanacetum coccineum]
MIHDEIELIAKGKNRKFLSVQNLQKIKKTGKFPVFREWPPSIWSGPPLPLTTSWAARCAMYIWDPAIQRSDEDVTTTPSPITTSSSPTHQNAPSKATSTNQTSSSQENTSSSFQSKLQILPPSSNGPTSPHLLNLLLDNISDVPPRPSNPQPLQSHPSLDITLSLSLITHLDHIHDTPSPPSPSQPQPPIMGHPLYYNYHDYH